MTTAPSSVRTPEQRARELRELNLLASSRVLSEIIRQRTRMMPFGVTVALALVWISPGIWRWALLGLAAVSLLSLGYFEWNNWINGRLTERQMLVTTWISGLVQLAVVFVLGGIAGPVVLAMPLIAVVMNLMAPNRYAMVFVLLVQVPAVWAMAAIHASGTLPDLVPPAWNGLFAAPGTPGWGPWLGAAIFTIVLVGGMALGRVMRDKLLRILREQVELRDRELEVHEETTRTLTQLTAEIAHELKNPLASVKGLAALVRKDLEGQTAERMDVLRREVDRMQIILEEFLSYSRPLVPIDEERVDLRELAEEVVVLHEGMASQRGVRLELDRGEAVHLRCDPRKIRRVLINLVQNAIEATPSDGRVRIELEREGSGVSIRVLDEGGGLSADAEQKIFSVGFTTKPQGSGIGLVLARGLARQHGGELVLENRAEGGCAAILTLPPVPAGERPEEQAAA